MLGIDALRPPHGGFASAIAVDARRLYPVHSKLSEVEAGLLEPATVAVHALRRTPLRLGDAVVVFGAGPIGLLVMQCARAAGAGAAVVVEPEPSRAKLAQELGATTVLDPGAEDFDEELRDQFGAAGPDVVFECAGIPETIDKSAATVRRGGVVALVGLASVPAEISPMNWLAREVQLIASLGYLHEEFDYTMQLIADGRLDVAALHTGTVGLEGLEGAFQRLLAGGSDVKILVDPRLS
jgi:(R,R)-butanediol dehydrogenase/meso-butanediol dehydrogenase/diacetyl reductase